MLGKINTICWLGHDMEKVVVEACFFRRGMSYTAKVQRANRCKKCGKVFRFRDPHFWVDADETTYVMLTSDGSIEGTGRVIPTLPEVTHTVSGL